MAVTSVIDIATLIATSKSYTCSNILDPVSPGKPKQLYSSNKPIGPNIYYQSALTKTISQNNATRVVGLM
jgi:hypothetical protein